MQTTLLEKIPNREGKLTRLKLSLLSKPFHSHNLIGNSPNCLPFKSYDVGSEKLLLDQLKIP